MPSPPTQLSLLALGLACAAPAFAAKAGAWEDGGSTLVSAMMMFVGNEEKVYILDKAEGNAAEVAGHPAWGSVWDLASRQATVMDVPSNVFCASGMHLPNGSFTAFGGNGAVGRGGQMGSVNDGWVGSWDAEYENSDGRRAIRILNPCTGDADFNSAQCKWFDDAALLAMKVPRWYSTAEPLADGTIALIGGFSTGGYINRNYPNTDPDGPASQNSYEFFPARAGDPDTPPNLPFLTRTSGLNTYVHAFMMPSGQMFLQANVSAILWDYNQNTETPLPEMPGGVVRVYPASGATAMLPLTPANKYNPTILFCGGTDMKDDQWGDYGSPWINTWDYPASKDCQRITPEPEDGSAPAYEQDDDMMEGRSMGQFIILPDGKYLVVNGAEMGTAGYAQTTHLIKSFADMPFGESLAAEPALTPAIYDPNAPKGSRWSREGLSAAKLPRMYHSSAILLPDASVLIAGSNPNVDVNTSTIFPTTYDSEIFFPPYFSAPVRPSPQGIPKTLSYGGDPFDITIPATSYSGSANDAADATIVSVIRPGFTTHAMNMGQRYMQLENSFTVKEDGSIVLHVGQMHPNPNVFQPGPAFVYVTIKGIPSNGTYVIVGSGEIGEQPTQAASVLPASVRLENVKGSASSDGKGDNQPGNNDSSTGGSDEEGGTSTGMIVGAAVGAVAAVAILGALIGVLLARRKRAAAADSARGYPMSTAGTGSLGAGAGGAGAFAGAAAAGHGTRDSDTSAFMPLAHGNQSATWNGGSPYTDYDAPRPSNGMSMDYDPYSSNPAVSGNPNRY
ncbi:copper radical oxidase variant A [Coprinopsis sp. MPI-PUGE-AT-0042]|nr:copper radical oxidase variant A [Coprinopsis sp. MPI-PUGE-AT-0042]